jgi:hypothetical protein
MPFHRNLDHAKNIQFRQLFATEYLTRAFQDFPQFLNEITRTVTEAGLRPTPSTYFSIVTYLPSCYLLLCRTGQNWHRLAA